MKKNTRLSHNHSINISHKRDIEKKEEKHTYPTNIAYTFTIKEPIGKKQKRISQAHTLPILDI
jgi:hypothetical protein